MSYAINNLPSCITIGRETETAVTEIRIDCAEWLDRWPDMDVSVIVRTGRGAIYIPANLTMEGKTLVWCVDDVDTSILNKSTMEITGIAPDRHKLSEKVDILVDERLAGTTGETPDPMKPWVDRVIEAANTVGDARDDAVSAKDEAFDSANVAYKAAFDARESEKNAHASEQEAAQSANIAKDAEENTRATLVTVNGLAEYAKSSAEMAKESEEKSLQNANNAGTYATSAKESEIIARESGETAKTSAQSAQTSAGSAAESANQAKRSEEAAKGYADNTGEYARIATEKAQKATEQANSAGVSATSAEESANRASASEQNAATSAQEAKSSADSTKGYSESANEAAVNASDSAREAQVSAENAAASANNAEASKASAQVSAENARVSSQNAEDALQELRDKIASGEFKGEPGEPGKDAVVDATLTQSGQAADAKVTGDALALKLTEPSTGLAVGKYFRIAAIDESGHAVLEAVDLPIANDKQAGMVQVSNYDGWYMYGNRLQARTIDSANYAGMNNTAIIGKGTLNSILSTPSVMPSLTAEEQTAARERMGQEAINRERERRLINLEYAARGYLYREETDTSLAYEKAVPDDVTPWITLDQIGGRTLVWNQMVNASLFPDTINTSGTESVQVNRTDGRVVIPAGSFDSVKYYTYTAIYPGFTVGHKVLICGCPAGGGTDTYQLYLQENHKLRDEGEGVITTVETDTFRPMIRIAEGDYPELVFTPQMFDLTVMFGAGNEPSTVAEFRAMFPDAYYPYAKPKLTTFTCNEVRVQGRNLYSGYDSFGWVEGETYAYARLPTNETYSLKIRLKDGASIPAGAFFGFGTGDYNTGAVTWLVQSGKIMKEQATSITSHHYLVCHPKTVYASMEDYLEISLVKGSTPELLPYRMERMDMSALTAKYFPDGMRSTALVHDALDLERGVAIQCVDCYVFDGSEKWTLAAEHNTCNRFYTSALQNGTGNAAPANVICNKLGTNADATVDKVGCCLTGTAPSRLFSIFLPKTEYTDADSVQQYVKAMADAGDPLIAYYGLYTPVETPITEELTTDVEVEPGGTLTFVNDQGDAYHVPVPNQETWLVKVGGAG